MFRDIRYPAEKAKQLISLTKAKLPYWVMMAQSNVQCGMSLLFAITDNTSGAFVDKS